MERKKPTLGLIASRAALAAVGWCTLTGGVTEGWLVGLPAVAVAALFSAWLLPTLALFPLGAIRFAGFFLRQSLLGGIDVARRAFMRRPPLSPAVVAYDFRVASELERVMLTNTVSLLPGTLGADLDRERLHVHVLDDGRDVRGELELAERRVAELFGRPLPAIGGRSR